MRSERSHSTALAGGADRDDDLWVELFDSDLIPLTGTHKESHDSRHRGPIYRAMLFLMVFPATILTIEGLFLGQLPAPLVVVAVTAVLLLLATLLRLLLAHAVLLPPVITLSMSVGLVLAAVAQGASHHSLFLFPLMIAIAALLPTRVALLFGVVTLALVILVRGDSVATFDLPQDTTLVATWLLSLSVMRMMMNEADKLTDLALTDPLTGAFNRHYLAFQTRRSLEDYQRYARLSTLMMVDIDHFKKINDQFGHAMGDQVLRAVVRLIEDRLRGVDMVFRYGGEEFVVLLAETGAKSGAKVADELREAVQAMDVLPRREVTVSIGVCDVSTVADTDEWLAQIDKAMYQAKAEGRNRVVAIESEHTANTRLSSTMPVWR